MEPRQLASEAITLCAVPPVICPTETTVGLVGLTRRWGRLLSSPMMVASVAMGSTATCG